MESKSFEDWLNEFNPPTFSIESGKWVLGTDAKAAILAAHRAAIEDMEIAAQKQYQAVCDDMVVEARREELEKLYNQFPRKVPKPIKNSPLELSPAAIGYNDALDQAHRYLDKRLAQLQEAGE